MIKLSKRAIAINAGAGIAILTGAISFVHTTFARPYVEPCATRYGRQILLQLDRDGAPLGAPELQAFANGQDEGVLDNLGVVPIKDGPAPYALAIKLAAGTGPQRSPDVAPGGISLPWTPSLIQQPRAACLSYNVLLPADFEFGYGGTLPGLFATTIDALVTKLPHVGANLAWRAGGEPLLFVDSTADDGQNAMGFKAYERQLPRGRWVRVDEEMVLNTPGQRDGAVRLWLDGKLEAEVKAADLRPNADVSVAGVEGNVFYGGSGAGGTAKADTSIFMTPFEIRWN